MNLGRVSGGEKIACVSAVLLFAFMFFDWFEFDVKPSSSLVLFNPLGGGNAWQTLDVIPIFLVLAIVVAVGTALIRLAGWGLESAFRADAAVALLGGLAGLLILYRIVFPPGLSGTFNGFTVEPTVEAPIFLALLAAVGVTFGGYRAMLEEDFSFAGLHARRHRSRD